MPAVSGVTKDVAGAFAQKLVRVYRYDTGAFVGAALSNATTGAWSVTTADTSAHFALMHDAIGDPLYHRTAIDLPLTSNLVDSRGHTFTAAGGAAISALQSKFSGMSSILLDGSGDYLSCTSTDFDPGANDFTMEGYVRLANMSAGRGMLGKSYTYNSGLCYEVEISAGGQVTGRASTNGSTITNASTAAGVITLNNWHHIAFERYAGFLKVYIDGAASGSPVAFSGAVFANTQPLLIGAISYAGVPDTFCNGNMNAIRFTLSEARYKGNFTPSATPYLAGPAAGTENELVLGKLIPV